MAIKIAGTEVINDNKRVLNNESLPDVRPSLLLDFANSKTLDPRITFTRGSTATYWDGKTTTKAEENLAKYSEDSTQSPWNSANGFTTSNATTAPNGETTADKFTENTDTDFHNLTRGSGDPISVGVTYTISLYLKNNSGTRNIGFRGLGNGGLGEFPIFNIISGTIVDSGTEWTNVSITDVGSGWYRCAATTTATVTFGLLVHHLDGSTQNYTGDGSSSTFFWGLQIEERSSATAYTPTTSAPIVKYQPVLQTAASGEARFDHDPVTGESKGLLIEEARTNSLTRSEEFDHAEWATSQSTMTVGTIVAPDGTLTGTKFTPNTTSAEHYADDALTQATGTFTDSVFAKAGGYNQIALRPIHIGADEGGSQTVRFDLDAGTVLSYPAGVTATIEDVGNGWYRCSMAYTASGTLSGAYAFRIQIYSDSGTNIFSGDGYSGIYIWGAQREVGSFPTSYIPTSGSTVTRAAEYASITGTNFSGFFSNQVGTIYAEYGKIHEGDPTIGERLVTVFPDDGTVKYNLEAFRAEVRYDASWDAIGLSNRSRDGGKVALAFDDTGFSAASIGTSYGSVSRQPYSHQSTKMYIGSSKIYGQTNACIAKVAYYPKRLTSAQLQAMTEA